MTIRNKYESAMNGGIYKINIQIYNNQLTIQQIDINNSVIIRFQNWDTNWDQIKIEI